MSPSIELRVKRLILPIIHCEREELSNITRSNIIIKHEKSLDIF